MQNIGTLIDTKKTSLLVDTQLVVVIKADDGPGCRFITHIVFFLLWVFIKYRVLSERIIISAQAQKQRRG